ncbi:MAG: hydroxymethylbilane synthase [Deltaproteobacteria bacterium]|nr:hydroxymethylbilane synthase [Deltaproteobacteria bacterium]
MAFRLRIGSRPSRLALAQTEIVRSRLASMVSDLSAEVVEIRTSGDRLASASLAGVGGKGLFIRELEQALMEKRIDLAVHSMKDLPATLEPQFRIGAVSEREDPRDVLVTRDGSPLASLPKGTRLGTSSLRRRFQVQRANPGLEISPLRGNVDTRLRRVTEGGLDAIVIAMAGLRRLGLSAGVRFTPLEERDFIPAGGQAALAIETLANISSPLLDRTLAALNDPRARFETTAERAFLAAIGASCATPVGAKATVAKDAVTLRAILFSSDGAAEMSDELEEPLDVDLAPSAAHSLGARLGERMLARGADRLIANE